MKNNYFKFIFLPILMIGLLFSFSACGDDEKDEVKDETLYQYEVQDFPAIEVKGSQLDGCWIETKCKKCFYGGKSQTVGDRIYYEKLIETQSTTYDINDFSFDSNRVEGIENAWSSFVFMQNGDCDYLSQYRKHYLFSPSFEMGGHWTYLYNGIINVHLVDKQQYSEDREWDEKYKIISYKEDEMTLRQIGVGENNVYDKVFRKFDIESVNAMLDKEKENL